MLYVGIDPGQSGGIVCIDHQSKVVAMMKMPKKICELISFLKNKREKIKLLCLEKAHACRPGQSTNASFTYGQHFGMLQGILITLAIPYKLVPPRTWQKIMICANKNISDPKKKALISANKVFKTKNEYWIATSRSKKPHDGIIDAALIAAYCRRTHKNET